jgi:glucokinase
MMDCEKFRERFNNMNNHEVYAVKIPSLIIIKAHIRRFEPWKKQKIS